MGACRVTPAGQINGNEQPVVRLNGDKEKPGAPKQHVINRK